MELSLALNRYDRHVPFFMGTVDAPDGISVRPLEVGESTPFRDGGERHERMLNGLEFDVAEVSLSSFIMAIARDPDFPLVGIPVFPRRFFSAGQIYVNADTDIRAPVDLIGRRVGIHAFQVTLSVLAKGDLKRDYGVAWEKINWVCMKPEVIPVELGDDVSVEAMPASNDMGMMLCDGEIDALISPQPRKSMLARPDRYRRLFDDPEAEEVRYFGKHGYFPIMHLFAMKRELVEQRPDLPRALMPMFEEANRQAYGFYDDSNYSLLVDGRKYYERERSVFADPWPNGLAANRANLEAFIGFSHDQRLIDAPYAPERLFHVSTHDT
jgi:4,5-dihydroxyphthalate decarboxylase